MQRKKWFIAVTAISLAIIAYFVFGFTRAVSSYNRGAAFMAKAEFDQAIACFDKALRIEPSFAEAYCNRGTAYYEKGQCDAAIADFSKAIEINADFAQAYYNRAVAYYDRQECDKAMQDAQKAQSLGCQVSPEFLKALQEVSRDNRLRQGGCVRSDAVRRFFRCPYGHTTNDQCQRPGRQSQTRDNRNRRRRGRDVNFDLRDLDGNRIAPFEL